MNHCRKSSCSMEEQQQRSSISICQLIRNRKFRRWRELKSNSHPNIARSSRKSSWWI